MEDFHLLKHLVCIKAHLTDNGGILKSLEIEYNEMIDLALCTPAAQYKLLLIYTCAQLELFYQILIKEQKFILGNRST